MSKEVDKKNEALEIIKDLGMPTAQINDRTALCLLALLDLSPNKDWVDIARPMIGITPIMDWVKKHYGISYAPNTRETFRRQSIHQFVQAGIVLYNPDDPTRAVNSPKSVYQIEPKLFSLLKKFGTCQYKEDLKDYLNDRQTLIERYAKEREMNLIPIRIDASREIKISAGDHSKLIKDIIEEFAPRFVPGGQLLYVGDTQKKWAYFDTAFLYSLGITVDNHGKMPDVVIYYDEKKWLVLIESVTSHGPIDSKRHNELSKIFCNATVGLVYVTAFPDKKTMNRYLNAIAWETEVWVSDSPTHMIHFNGIRFLGPY